MFGRAKRYIGKHGGLKASLKNFYITVKSYGIMPIMANMLGIDYGLDGAYRKWLRVENAPLSQEEVKSRLAALSIQPKISFIIPVYNVGEPYLRVCLDSIINQYYQNWEICIADDCSTAPHIKPVIHEYMEKYSNIKAIFRETNGHISEASNTALTLATGEYIAHMDNDDYIEPFALLEIVEKINAHPDADMIYTDEDKVDERGKLNRDGFFKPDWSPDALLSHMYVTHLGIYRRAILEKIGGFKSKYNGSQDYEMLLRFAEQTNAIYHVPRIMYHWRMLPTSAASGDNVKDYAFDAGVQGKIDALKRRSVKARVEVNHKVKATHIVYEVPEDLQVTFVIRVSSSQNAIDAIASIKKNTPATSYECLCVGHDSTLLKAVKQVYNEVKTICVSDEVSDAEMLNQAAQTTKGDVLVFMDQYMRLSTPDWYERVLGHALQPHTGCVGIKTAYKNGAVCNAGINIVGQKPAFAFQHWLVKDSGYFGRLLLEYNYIAVPKLFMAIERTKFQKIGGFDTKFGFNYYDVALGMMLQSHGMYQVTRSDAMALFSGASKKHGIATYLEYEATERQELMVQFPKYMQEDPFYNRNFKQNRADYALDVTKFSSTGEFSK